MDDPLAQPGDAVLVRHLDGRVSGPVRVERVVVTLNASGRFDRYFLDVPYAFPDGVPSDRVLRVTS